MLRMSVADTSMRTNLIPAVIYTGCAAIWADVAAAQIRSANVTGTVVAADATWDEALLRHAASSGTLSVRRSRAASSRQILFKKDGAVPSRIVREPA